MNLINYWEIAEKPNYFPMKRRSFLTKSAAVGLAPLSFETYRHSGRTEEAGAGILNEGAGSEDMVVEKFQPGLPHKGKVLAASTVAKLIKEGYTGYLIRTTNDDHAGRGASQGEVILNNEKDNEKVAAALGLSKVYDLGYRNHRMNNISMQELTARFIFLFRMLKVDTVVSYDPWGHYEENPDHYVTASAVEAACWMAGGGLDYPEHKDAGILPHTVREKYYYARGPQLVNRIVDISESLEQKVESNRVIVTQGPGGDAGIRLRDRLAEEGKTLPILEGSDENANRNYIKNIVLDIDSQRIRGVPSDRETGKAFGLEWAEQFHYIGPRKSRLEEYIRLHN